MPIRFKTGAQTKYGQQPLPSGYENSAGAADLSIPSCGIEDVDTALFNLIDKEIAPEYGGNSSTPITKVPVVFAAGEKWALLKRGRPLRDRNNTLLLPLITVMRTDLNQSLSEDVTKRGINQQTGEIVIRRKLDKYDRDYQALINRYLLPNQRNLAVKPTDSQVPGQVTTLRTVGDLSQTKAGKDGAYLTPDLSKNLIETIVVPSPQFYTAKYQITIWTQYTQHSNQILEKIFSTFLPQAQSWKLDTPKGYWFVARMEDGSLSMETNFDDMSNAERFIKHTFTVSVPAYFFVSSAPGVPVAIKRYISSPTISFQADIDPVVLETSEQRSSYVLGSDDPTLPLDEQKNNRADQRNVGWRQQKIYPVVPKSFLDAPDAIPEDPALTTISRGSAVKVVSKTAAGETVYSGAQLGGLEIVVTK